MRYLIAVLMVSGCGMPAGGFIASDERDMLNQSATDMAAQVVQDMTTAIDLSQALDLRAACPLFHADCNGKMVDGCEVDTESDNLNCGSCGVACPHGQVCYGGSCTPCSNTCGPKIYACCPGTPSTVDYGCGLNNECFACGRTHFPCCPVPNSVGRCWDGSQCGVKTGGICG